MTSIELTVVISQRLIFSGKILYLAPYLILWIHIESLWFCIDIILFIPLDVELAGAHVS